MKPTFSAFRTVLMHNMDAVVCIANIRGGAEYGEDWHKAGALHGFDCSLLCAVSKVQARVVYRVHKALCLFVHHHRC
jgi:hypothetical protein